MNPTDFNDMAALHGLDAVKQAIAGAQKVGAGDTVTGESDASRIVVVSLMDFVTREIPPRERILAPWLLTQSLNMVYAWRGIGKTHVALGIAYATASGTSSCVSHSTRRCASPPTWKVVSSENGTASRTIINHQECAS
mgnify:CR=1 FL=1